MNEQKQTIQILNDIYANICDLKTSRELERIIYEKYEKPDKSFYEKAYDYDQIGILTQVFYDRFFDEVKTLEKLYEELEKILCARETERSADEQTA